MNTMLRGVLLVILCALSATGCGLLETVDLSVLPHELAPFSTEAEVENKLGGDPARKEIKNDECGEQLVHYYYDSHVSGSLWQSADGIYSYQLYFRMLVNKKRPNDKGRWRLVGFCYEAGNAVFGDAEMYMKGGVWEDCDYEKCSK